MPCRKIKLLFDEVTKKDEGDSTVRPTFSDWSARILCQLLYDRVTVHLQCYIHIYIIAIFITSHTPEKIANEPVSFATFVDSFDVKDKLTKKFFEFLLREVRRRRNRRQRSLQRPRMGLSEPPWQHLQRSLQNRRQTNQLAQSLNVDQSVEMSLYV